MKKHVLFLLALALVLGSVGIWLFNKPIQKTHKQSIAKSKLQKEKLPPSRLLPMMAEHQQSMLRDPKTGTSHRGYGLKSWNLPGPTEKVGKQPVLGLAGSG